MSDSLDKTQLAQIIAQVNKEFGVQLHIDQFNSQNYSMSSIREILAQRIAEALNDDWTIDKSFGILQKNLASITGVNPATITQESELETLLPKSERKAIIKKLEAGTGLKLEILKPNSVIYGILIFLFFACIPFGIGMDWFLSGIVMIATAILIFIVTKTGNDLKYKTLGQWAERVTWDNYLKSKKDRLTLDDSQIAARLEKLL